MHHAQGLMEQRHEEAGGALDRVDAVLAVLQSAGTSGPLMVWSSTHSSSQRFTNWLGVMPVADWLAISVIRRLLATVDERGRWRAKARLTPRKSAGPHL
jgi:hypothetical protein